MPEKACLAGVLLIAPLILLSSGTAAARDTDYIVVGAGWYDALSEETAASFRLEFRSGHDMIWGIKPFAGLMATSGASVYGYGGICRDFDVGNRIVLTVNWAVGAFDEGNGKDLGGVAEFRLGGEVAYRFDNKVRLGVTFYHLSNANTANHNPGVEVLGAFLSYPLSGG